MTAFTTQSLIDLIAYLGIISASAERATEVVKGVLGASKNPIKPENMGKVSKVVAYAAGAVLAFVMPPDHLPLLASAGAATPILVGLLASGGSGMMHDLLGVVTNFKQSIK